MNNIQFDEEPQYARPIMGSEKPSLLSGLVIKTGLAKDNVGAQKVLLIVFALVVFATIFVLWTANDTSPSPSRLSSQLIIKAEIPLNIRNEIPPAVFNSLPAQFYPKDLSQSTLNQLPSDLRKQLGV